MVTVGSGRLSGIEFQGVEPASRRKISEAVHAERVKWNAEKTTTDQSINQFNSNLAAREGHFFGFICVNLHIVIGCPGE